MAATSNTASAGLPSPAVVEVWVYAAAADGWMAELRVARPLRSDGGSRLLLLEQTGTRRQARQLLADVCSEYGFGPVPTPAGHVVCKANQDPQVVAAAGGTCGRKGCVGPHVVIRAD